MPDRNEEVTFAIAAAITGGQHHGPRFSTVKSTTFLEFFRKQEALRVPFRPLKPDTAIKWHDKSDRCGDRAAS